MSWDTTTSFTLINYKQTRAGNKKKLFYFVFENKVSPVSIIPGNASFCLDSKIATELGHWNRYSVGLLLEKWEALIWRTSIKGTSFKPNEDTRDGFCPQDDKNFEVLWPNNL